MSTHPTPPPVLNLSPDDASLLLDIARRALIEAAKGNPYWQPALEDLPESLRKPGACFVTLYTNHQLHGCIGSVEAIRPLALDVARNAVSAARNDPRFPVLRADELDDTEIEISILTPMVQVPYRDLNDLIARLRPGVDGVLVEQGRRRGLLLPQVWEKLPDPYEFLAHVALKPYASIGIYDEPDTNGHVFQVHSYPQPAPASR